MMETDTSDVSFNVQELQKTLDLLSSPSFDLGWRLCSWGYKNLDFHVDIDRIVNGEHVEKHVLHGTIGTIKILAEQLKWALDLHEKGNPEFLLAVARNIVQDHGKQQ